MSLPLSLFTRVHVSCFEGSCLNALARTLAHVFQCVPCVCVCVVDGFACILLCVRCCASVRANKCKTHDLQTFHLSKMFRLVLLATRTHNATFVTRHTNSAIKTCPQQIPLVFLACWECGALPAWPIISLDVCCHLPVCATMIPHLCQLLGVRLFTNACAHNRVCMCVTWQTIISC